MVNGLHVWMDWAMRRFLVNPCNITGNKALITGKDARHIRKVLRMNVGDVIQLIDGNGQEYVAQIKAVDVDGVQAVILKENHHHQNSQATIVVAQSFLKEKKMDELIRPMTELGVSKWIPFFSERSIPRPDTTRLNHRLNRWKTIANESLKQCRRNIAIEIENPVSFQETLKIGATFDVKILFWEKENLPISRIKNDYPFARSIFIMLGPEGGFSETEAEAAKSSGFIIASLGPRILKSETATIAACAIIQFLYGDMGLAP